MTHLTVVPPPPPETEDARVRRVLAEIGLSMIRVSEAFAAVSAAMEAAVTAVAEYTTLLRDTLEREKADKK